jgi:D-amino-acid dehydrogenase
MKVLVLGGGVIGVTTAYYLARAGHEVEVVERRDGPGEETSFANAGQVSPGYSSPWAGPGVPMKAVKWLTMKHGPLVIRPKLDPAMWRWMLSMLRNCTSARYAINKARMVPIAEYSRDCLRALREETGIAYDERSRGTLQLFRTQKQLDGVGQDIDVLRQFGVAYGCSTARAASAPSRRWPMPGPISSAASGCPATRPATAGCSRSGWRRWPRNSASASPTKRKSGG